MFRYLALASMLVSQPCFAAGSTGSNETVDRPIETIVIASSACVISETETPDKAAALFGPILGFLAPLAVEFFFDKAGEELTRVRKATSAGSAEFHLWSRDSDEKALGLRYNLPKCVTVLTGKFRDKPRVDERYLSAPAIAQATQVPNDPGFGALRPRLSSNGIEFDTLNLAFEAKLVPSPDGTSYYYEPQLLAAYDFLPGSRSDKQGLVVDLALQGPGTTPWGAVYSSAAISFGEVEEGTVIDRRSRGRRALEKLDTGLMSFPGISDDAHAALRRDQDGAIKDVMPARLRAEWTQTKKPSDAARVLAFLLSKAKPKASGWVGEQFDSDVAFNGEQADQALEIAYLDAKVKLEALGPDASEDARRLAELRLERAKAAFDRSQE